MATTVLSGRDVCVATMAVGMVVTVLTVGLVGLVGMVDMAGLVGMVVAMEMEREGGTFIGR
eukprot:245011-Amorphochlora_amoeboformis.AAC.1